MEILLKLKHSKTLSQGVAALLKLKHSFTAPFKGPFLKVLVAIAPQFPLI